VRLKKDETRLRPEKFGELVLRKDEILLECVELVLRKDEILLEPEDFPDLPELMLSLPVSARFRAVKGLETVVELMRLMLGEDVPDLKNEELMRLRLGEDVPDLSPSSCREVRRCSVLCLLRTLLSRSEWATSLAKLICGLSLSLFFKHFGCFGFQRFGLTPASTISAKVGDRDLGMESTPL
jgi:hypothetical protein